nr:hypothetical protein [Sinobaca sp. H24]
MIEQMLEKKKQSAEETRVAIQGFGNGGQIAARLLFDQGFKVVGVSDSKTALYDKEGLDIPKAQKAKENAASRNTEKNTY